MKYTEYIGIRNQPSWQQLAELDPKYGQQDKLSEHASPLQWSGWHGTDEWRGMERSVVLAAQTQQVGQHWGSGLDRRQSNAVAKYHYHPVRATLQLSVMLKYLQGGSKYIG